MQLDDSLGVAGVQALEEPNAFVTIWDLGFTIYERFLPPATPCRIPGVSGSI